MISDCLDGQVDLILTKSISRFARNTVDTVTTIRKLKEKGVAVYFEKKDFYTVKMPINAVNTALSKGSVKSYAQIYLQARLSEVSRQ